MIHLGDIRNINGAEIEPVDVITGGSPCQDLSIAGNRKGLAGERSGLFMEQIRVIKEMREGDRKRGRTDEFIRPRYCVFENVAGLFSSNRGADFQAVLTEFVRVAEPDAPAVPMPEKGKWPKSGCVYDNMGGGAWPGGSMTLNSGECRRDESGLLWLRTSEDSQPRRYCLTLNIGEKPREPMPTKLSQVLEPETDPRYRLSAKACQGILNRAERRGKELPRELRVALEEQIGLMELTEREIASVELAMESEELKTELQERPEQSASRKEVANLGGQGNSHPR